MKRENVHNRLQKLPAIQSRLQEEEEEKEKGKKMLADLSAFLFFSSFKEQRILIKQSLQVRFH